MNTEQLNEAEENVSIDLEESGSVEVEQAPEPEQLSDSEQSTSEGGSENYSDNVKKRINQLTAKRKQAVEEAEAAVQYAQQIQQQNEQMKQRIAQMDQGYVTEYSSRVDSQFEQAKKLLKEARDMGEIDKEIDAQELLSRLSIEKERVRMSNSRVQEAQQPQPQQAQQPQPQQQLDAKLVSWMGKNDNWFNKDLVMTRGAQAIHETLVASEGYDPTSDDYYSEIDKRMRHEFPHKFQSQRQNAQSVAPASSGRSIKSGRKKSVELTPGQVAFAKKMNIPLERYAKEVAKLDSRS